jgi:ATP-dependent helicase/nuclease subunit A
VKIMTVHAAKGLEFPIVFVPELNFYRGADRSLLAFSDTVGIGIDAPDRANGHALVGTMAKRAIEAENERKESAERKRLLYVALTRAKDHLVMCGHRPNGNESEKDLWINSIIEATSLSDEDIEAGVKRLGPELEVLIRTDLSSIAAEERIWETTARLTASDLAPFIVGREHIEVVPSRPYLSPSHISAEPKDTSNNPFVERSDVPEINARRGESLDSIPAVRGTMIHEILSEKDPIIVLRRYGIEDPSKIEEYSAMYERFMADPIMANVSEAYRELAFMAKIGDDIYKGRIDLLLRREDGSWEVVDHKTGSFQGQLGEDKVREYSAQMKVYQAAIEQLVQKKIRTSLYLVDEGRVLSLR